MKTYIVAPFIVQGLAGTGGKPREILFAGLFHDPGMVAGDSMDEALKEHWANDIDRDRG
jgi:hypothetical protein